MKKIKLNADAQAFVAGFVLVFMIAVAMLLLVAFGGDSTALITKP